VVETKGALLAALGEDAYAEAVRAGRVVSLTDAISQAALG
jgi:hypothetical protein